MTAGYSLTKTAEEELANILRFIAERDGVERALHAHDRFAETFEALALMPGAGDKRPHLTGEHFRWRTVFHFVVIYDPEASPVTVLRILHGARDLDRILRPDD